MASPIAHGLVGAAVHVATARGRAELGSAARTLTLVALASAADLDLGFRLLDGRNHHQGVTHSVGFAVLVAVVTWVVGRWTKGGAGAFMGFVAGLAWWSHGVVDYLSGDTTPPFGPMLLWPFTADHFISPWSLFLETRRVPAWATVTHDAWAVARELVILVPALSVVWCVRFGRASGLGRSK
jgi:inner membrane protein